VGCGRVLGDTNSSLTYAGSSLSGVGVETGELLHWRSTHLTNNATPDSRCSDRGHGATWKFGRRRPGIDPRRSGDDLRKSRETTSAALNGDAWDHRSVLNHPYAGDA
jgi:hypothetical protein